MERLIDTMYLLCKHGGALHSQCFHTDQTMAELRNGFSRRNLLTGAALATADFALTGCRHTYLLRPPTPALRPLTIDVHCHIFNGTDLPVIPFLINVFDVQQDEAEAVAELIHRAGVAGKKELLRLDELIHAYNNLVLQSGSEAASKNLQGQLKQWREETVKSIHDNLGDALHKFRNIEKQMAYEKALQGSSPDPLEKKAGDESSTAPAKCTGGGSHGYNLFGVLGMIYEYCCARIVCAQDYLNTFCPPARRGVDLMFASLVDYDWWLARGTAPETDLKTQVEIMQRITVLSGGRVHGIVPFCPLRAVAHHSGQPLADWNPLDLVQDAIQNKGFIGVKLYPPMGFAPYGNKFLDAACDSSNPCPNFFKSKSFFGTPNFWNNPDFPAWLYEGPISYNDGMPPQRLGIRLDQELDSLYKWCTEHRVPIMAHTNATNGVCSQYEALAGYDFWGLALQQYKDLQVNFGHLGGLSNRFDPPHPHQVNDLDVPTESQGFISLMNTYTSVFGDAAFQDGILHSARDRFDTMVEHGYPANPVLQSRFLFATDWSLLMETGGDRPYLKNFLTLFEDIDKSPSNSPGLSAAQAFFGGNAAVYAGLRQSECTRTRLQTFYSANNILQPEWASKLEALSSRLLPPSVPCVGAIPLLPHQV
jgi:hypothetical protein